MLLDNENGKRVGIKRVISQHAEANNKYMYDYDETKESTYITYFDFSNRYGCTLKTFLAVDMNMLKIYERLQLTLS